MCCVACGKEKKIFDINMCEDCFRECEIEAGL